jgi:hypothetical protein
LPTKVKAERLPKQTKAADWRRELAEWLEIAKGLKA